MYQFPGRGEDPKKEKKKEAGRGRPCAAFECEVLLVQEGHEFFLFELSEK
jgi:hypothetical protein